MRGFGIRTWVKRKLGFPSREGQPERGRQFSMAPVLAAGVSARTVIDIGVATGSPNVYAAFPDAYLLLVEPVVEFTPPIEGILAGRKGEHIACAAGATAGEISINVYPDSHLQSSLFSRSDFRGRPGEPRQVPIAPLDWIVAARTVEDPIFIKIDAEGAEVDVLRGATETLKRTSGVVVEVTLDDRYGGDTERLGETTDLMAAKGFRLVGILDAWVDQGRMLVLKADLLFVPAAGPKSGQV